MSSFLQTTLNPPTGGLIACPP